VTEETLRDWVRGTLRPEQRRGVSRWLVQSTDPRIARVMRGLIREWQDERQDQLAIAGSPNLAAVFAAFHQLLGQGRAAVVGLGLPSLVPAGVGRVSDQAVLAAERSEDGSITIRFQLESRARCALLATEDGGQSVVLMAWAEHAPGAHKDVGWRPDPGWARPTLWWLSTSAATPTSLADPMAAIRAAAADSSVDLSALRWEDLER
jgi:hypothetical protein